MEDKEIELEETEASYTPGGAGQSRVQVSGKWRGWVNEERGHGQGAGVRATQLCQMYYSE
jgi:hypothetical protein